MYCIETQLDKRVDYNRKREEEERMKDDNIGSLRHGILPYLILSYLI